jgi:hypothetical protein
MTALDRLVALLGDNMILIYVKFYIERYFYRNIFARTREKPEKQLWELWFGDNTMKWGILLAPVYRSGSWVNDVSEIRKAKYNYWTIGHILATGLIDPGSLKPLAFKTIEDLEAFYFSVLKRMSVSPYEQRIAEMYVEYIRSSSDPLDEPFLIPELRYAGLQNLHRFRLDFAVLNSHTMRLLGFEISPQSTHMAIDGKQRHSKSKIRS